MLAGRLPPPPPPRPPSLLPSQQWQQWPLLSSSFGWHRYSSLVQSPSCPFFFYSVLSVSLSVCQSSQQAEGASADVVLCFHSYAAAAAAAAASVSWFRFALNASSPKTTETSYYYDYYLLMPLLFPHTHTHREAGMCGVGGRGGGRPGRWQLCEGDEKDLVGSRRPQERPKDREIQALCYAQDTHTESCTLSVCTYGCLATPTHSSTHSFTQLAARPRCSALFHSHYTATSAMPVSRDGCTSDTPHSSSGSSFFLIFLLYSC